MMTGTIAVRELGGPIRPIPSGPSQPSAPIIQVNDRMSPNSVRSVSEIVRVNRKSSPVISSSASPISGAIPDSVASLYSSSTIAGDRLLTARGPPSPTANSLILRSASLTLSSPVSLRLMLAIATGVPSVSVPVIAAIAPPICGTLPTASISTCVIDSRFSNWSAA